MASVEGTKVLYRVCSFAEDTHNVLGRCCYPVIKLDCAPWSDHILTAPEC